MKNVSSNPGMKKSKQARVRLAKVVVARHSYSKVARQAAFRKAVSHVPADKAVAKARLISGVIQSEFRIIRMPG